MIRIAAVGDVHYDRSSRGRLSQYWDDLLEGKACALLVAGDLTQVGHEDEGKVLAEDLAECPIPVVAVLGNHDYHGDQEKRICEHLLKANVTILDRSSTILKAHGKTIGIYGVKGFCGGFIGASCSDFGEREIKNFIGHTKEMAKGLKEGLLELKTDYKIALLHYSPTPDTLLGERKEIYPFLGSYLLGESIDRGGAHVVFHGHAHKGTEYGKTPGGVPVRNVAQHVIHKAFKIYSLDELSQNLTPVKEGILESY